jgi:holliday junction DNA helicase RuvA
VIALVRGTLARVGDDHVVIDTGGTSGGVGYEVFCHLRTITTLQASHEREIALHVHTSVSDDAIRLYGFGTQDELRLFRLLIGVERIGPKAALGILGRAELPVLVRAIAEGDIALVATVPGIGRKTAERVILELRDKVASLEPPGTHHAAAAAGENEAVTAAIAGLVGLGFREGEARNAVAAIAVETDAHDVADLVGAALRRLDTAAAAR